ncbi:hypothetical protein ABIA35_007919 [Catenulispora sp. MAP12-49]
MDGPLPIWEGTPRAVPPPLGAPPPVESKRPARIGVAAGVPVHQGPMRAAVAEPRTLWGSGPANGRSVVSEAGAGSQTSPVRHPPTSTGQAPLKRRGRLVVGAGAAVAVVAFAATALAMWSGTSATTSAPTGMPSSSPVSGTSPIPNTSPVSSAPKAPAPAVSGPLSQALANLSDQQLLRYSGVSPDGRASWQLTVTAGGQAQGAIELGDGKLGVLQVGGRTYFRADDTASAGLLGELPSGVTAASVRGTWVTGESALEALLPSGLASAGDLAASLRSALSSSDAGFPSPTVPTPLVDGEAAVPVTTSAGVLYISTAQPYRVLRLVPVTAGPGQPTDVETVSQSTAKDVISGLVDQTRTLTAALDFGIVFQYGQDPQLRCSRNACTVEADGVVASGTDPTGSVVADVTATVSVDGQPAGQCEVIAKLPLDQPQTFHCQDPDAVSVVRTLGGGDGLDVSVNLGFQARADTQQDVGALVGALAGAQQGGL